MNIWIQTIDIAVRGGVVVGVGLADIYFLDFLEAAEKGDYMEAQQAAVEVVGMLPEAMQAIGLILLMDYAEKKLGLKPN